MQTGDNILNLENVSGYVARARVLLVDDEPGLRADLRSFLTVVGYDLDEASNGDEALALISAGNSYDLILTDIVMPGAIQGDDLARYVAKYMPEARVLLMSGDPGVLSRKVRGKMEGKLIVKPVHAGDLLLQLQDALVPGDSTGRRGAEADKEH